MNSKKRTLDAFFTPSSKKPKPSTEENASDINHASASKHSSKFSTHAVYPHPIRELPELLAEEIKKSGSKPGKVINDQVDLDLLYFQPYMPKAVAKDLFDFLRSELPFYRVDYNIKRGGIETQVKTPRYTTVFGLDETSRFTPTGEIVTTAAKAPVLNDKNYTPIPPRPIPACLSTLLHNTEASTGFKYNFCLVNYYSSGSDSISYHSDDETFLGKDPTIASFSLGSSRDFLMKHKPFPAVAGQSGGSGEVAKPLKLQLGSGDMMLMKGKTQKNWLHSIPKRSGKGEGKGEGGRINITFRKALVRAGTENYYRYNVGNGPVYRWDNVAGEMRLWKEKVG